MSVAPSTAPHTLPAPADHGHEQVLDALVDAERRRIDEALQVRVEPAGDAREQCRVHEHHDLESRRVDAEGLDHVEPPFNARTARPGRESEKLRVDQSAASAIAQIRKNSGARP
jgi:hypothetical protein